MTLFHRARRETAPPWSGRRRVRFSFIESLEPRTLLSGAAADGYIGSIAPLTTPQTAKGDWTVMVYVTATDLSENAKANLVEMERAAAKLPESVRIVVLLDQWANLDESGKSTTVAPAGSANAWRNQPGAMTFATGSGSQPAWSTVGVGIVSPHAEADGENVTSSFTISTTEADSGDSAVLRNFVVQASMMAPADHYALILWDHGGGVAGFNVDSYDVLPSNELTTSKLVTALDEASRQGVRMDLVAFDECLMSTAEVAYALRDLTPVLVGSEELVGGDGWDYVTALDALMTPTSATARDLARSMVQSFEGRYGAREAARASFAMDNSDTLSAIDVTAMPTLASALHAFVASTAAARPADWSAIMGAYRRTPFFGGKFTENYRDLGQFMTSIAGSARSPAIRAAARGVASALGSAVFARSADQRQTAGLSIGLPPRSSGVDHGYFSQASAAGFLAATDWNQFQARFHRAAARTRGLAGGEANWAYNEYGANSALDLKTLVGKRLRVPSITIEPGATAWYKFQTAATGARGDAIRLVGGDRLKVKLVSPDDMTQPLRQGVGKISLRGLEAGTYLLGVTTPARQPAARFGLSVSAPSGSAAPTDEPGDNDSRDKAVNLGLISISRLVPSQSRSSAGRSAWYAFQTPISVKPYAAEVVLVSDGQPLTLTLLDADGNVLKRSGGGGRGLRGARDVRVAYDVQGDGDQYYLKVDGPPGAYSLFFGDHPTV